MIQLKQTIQSSTGIAEAERERTAAQADHTLEPDWIHVTVDGASTSNPTGDLWMQVPPSTEADTGYQSQRSDAGGRSSYDPLISMRLKLSRRLVWKN